MSDSPSFWWPWARLRHFAAGPSNLVSLMVSSRFDWSHGFGGGKGEAPLPSHHTSPGARATHTPYADVDGDHLAISPLPSHSSPPPPPTSSVHSLQGSHCVQPPHKEGAMPHLHGDRIPTHTIWNTSAGDHHLFSPIYLFIQSFLILVWILGYLFYISGFNSILP